MICCCALAGTAACKNCNRMAEFEYPPNYLKDRSYITGTGERVMELLNAVKILNERIDNLEERWDSWTNPLPKNFPKNPYEGQTWIKDGNEYVYKDDVWVQFK